MRIQFITAARKENYERKSGRGYNLPTGLAELKQEVKVNLKENFWRFYFDYLKFKPDFVVTQGLVGGIVGIFRKIGLIRKPVIFDWNDYYTEIMGKKYGIVKTAILEYSAVSFSDFITTVSPYLKSVCENLNKKCLIIPSGISEDMDNNEKIKLPGKNKFKILYIGEISKYKRTKKLIEAVRNLKCDLILVGKFIDETIDKSKIPENVFIINQIPHNQVASYINSADVCVDTQDQDTSLKIWEYIARGKAILALNGRKSYLLEHRKNVYLTDNFRQGIIELLTDKKLKNELENNCEKLKIYKWNEVSARYLLLLKKIKEKGIKNIEFKEEIF